MALATPGPLVSQVKGKIGGTLFRTSGSHLLLSRMKSPTRRDSPWAVYLQAAITVCNACWTQATAAERAQWDAFGQRYTWPNKFGKRRYITGRQAWTYAYFNYLDLFDRPALPSPIAAPPVGTVPTPAVTSASVDFHATPSLEYNVTTVMPILSNTLECCYAARGSSAKAGAQKTWTYIGSQFKVGDTTDWYSFFSDARQSFELQVGEPFWVRVYHFDYSAFVPNNPTLIQGVMAA